MNELDIEDPIMEPEDASNPTEQFRGEARLAASRLILATSGVIKRGGNPTVHTKKMNAELDAAYAEALASIQASTLRFFTALIGEDEASKEIREFRCPLYDECYESFDYYAVTKGGDKFCPQHGRKVKLYEAKEPKGEEWTRNELRAELRTKIDQLIKDLSNE